MPSTPGLWRVRSSRNVRCGVWVWARTKMAEIAGRTAFGIAAGPTMLDDRARHFLRDDALFYVQHDIIELGGGSHLASGINRNHSNRARQSKWQRQLRNGITRSPSTQLVGVGAPGYRDHVGVRRGHCALYLNNIFLNRRKLINIKQNTSGDREGVRLAHAKPCVRLYLPVVLLPVGVVYCRPP